MKKPVNEMTHAEFKAFTKGKFFSVKFIKKDNTLREYKGCRTEVSKFTKGGKNTVESAREHMVTVYTPNEKRPYSTLNLETIKEFKFQGKTEEF